MTEVNVNENGQAFFDFDVLEKKTSKEFAEKVDRFIKIKKVENYKEIHGNVISVVFIVQDYILTRCQFLHVSKDIDITFLSYSEVDIMKSMFDGDFNGKN